MKNYKFFITRYILVECQYGAVDLTMVQLRQTILLQ